MYKIDILKIPTVNQLLHKPFKVLQKNDIPSPINQVKILYTHYAWNT